MKTTKSFRGTGVAITTPFNKNEEIDYIALKNQINHVIKGGIDYIVLFGTTGEAPTITFEEKKHATKEVISYIANRVPLVLGMGDNNTKELVEQIKSFDFTGVDAILSVCPYYNKPNQEGIYNHYKAICENSPLPVILYNVPGRSVVNMEVDTALRIANDFKNVIAIKEATDNLDHVMEIISRKPEDLHIIAGDDALALAFMVLGADGLISVIANAFPRELSNIIKFANEGNFSEARKYHYHLLPLMHTLLKMGNPSGIKAVMNCIGLCENNFRLPVHKVNDEQYSIISEETKKLIK